MAFRNLIPGVAAAVGAAALVLWLRSSPASDLTERVEGTDRAPGVVEEAVSVFEHGELIKGAGVPADLPGAWPRFRGPNLDNISPEAVPLARSWGPSGPKVLWSIEVGEGYAGAAVLNGRVYLMDYDRKAKADALRCLSLADGKEIWRYSYPVRVKRNHGMSRTVPAVTGKHVVSLGPKCHVLCLDSTSGERRWAMDLVKDFHATVPPWYAGQCPLLDGERAILAPGGDALMVAVDCATGKVVWKTPNPDGWKMTHASVVPMEFQGQRMYVYGASGGVVGVAADDGRLLWKTADWRIKIAAVPSPVPVVGGRIFLTGGYEAGSLMLELKGDGGKIVPSPVFTLEPGAFDSAQHTPIFFDRHLYSVRSDQQLACMDLTGKVVWKSGAAHRFGLGPYLIASGLLFVMNDKAMLTLAEATPEGFRPLGPPAQILKDAHDSWGPMALAGGRLIVRDFTRMVCLDVKEP